MRKRLEDDIPHRKKLPSSISPRKKEQFKWIYLFQSHNLESLPGGKYLGVYISQGHVL
jgi:hypothetical protein